MERSDVWLLSGYTFRGVAVLFRPFLGPQSTPTLLHISAIVRNQNFIAVYIKFDKPKGDLDWKSGSQEIFDFSSNISVRSEFSALFMFMLCEIFGHFLLFFR